MKLSDKIAVLRRKRGWSQEELAEWLSVSRQSISRWESGRAAPDAGNIVRLSRLFNVSTDWLLLDEHGLSDAPAEDEEDNLTVEDEVLVAEPLCEDETPDTESTVRRIRASDTYEFAVLYQDEARHYALGCAALPLSLAPTTLMLGISELITTADATGAFGAFGLLIGIVILLMGLCELLCFWLGGSQRKLNFGKPYELDPNALSWAHEAYARSQLRLEKRTNVAIVLALLIVPSSIVCMLLMEFTGSHFWTGMAISAPAILTSGAVFVRSHASRMNRCYRHLLECAQKDENPDSTDG